VRWLSRLVTFTVIIAVVVAVGAWIRSRMPETKLGQDFQTCASFRDATRLAPGSPVMIAGVRIGEVSHMYIAGNLAHIEMTLRNGTEIPIDSWVTKRAYSAFGDSYLEIIPTTGDPGAAPVRTLRSGECLTRVLEGASTDTLLRSVSRVMPRIEDGLDRMHEVGLEGRKWASGTLEESLTGAEHWLDEGHIEKPLENANQAMAHLEDSTTRAAAAVSSARPDVEHAFDKIEKGVAAARQRITELKGDMKGGLSGVRDGLGDVDQTVADIQEVVQAIDEGKGDDYKGTLGKLVNDPHLADDLEEATDAIREGTGSFSRFKSYLGLRTEFDIFSRSPRFFVTAEVRARTDKFYLVELEKGPLGSFPDDRLGDSAGIPEFIRHQEIHDKIRFTMQFGKTFANWINVRGGVKESAFGFGVDLLMNEGRLKISADAYGGVTRTPRLKLAGALEVFRSVYLIAGIDDALNAPHRLPIVQGNTNVPLQFNEVRYGRDYFLGASLNFDEADLAMLLRVYGALLVGLL
jgi:phospholipid/cholesterol/gamma-HCH transport system substrate-binding protein